MSQLDDLEAAAREELEQATSLGWSELSRLTPWGDTYEGFSPGGCVVCFERTYLWDTQPGGDIRVEVVVYEPRDFEGGVKLTREIRREPRTEGLEEDG